MTLWTIGALLLKKKMNYLSSVMIAKMSVLRHSAKSAGMAKTMMVAVILHTCIINEASTDWSKSTIKHWSSAELSVSKISVNTQTYSSDGKTKILDLTSTPDNVLKRCESINVFGLHLGPAVAVCVVKRHVKTGLLPSVRCN